MCLWENITLVSQVSFLPRFSEIITSLQLLKIRLNENVVIFFGMTCDKMNQSDDCILNIEQKWWLFFENENKIIIF